MDFPRLRDSLIRKFGGASLLEDLHPGEANAAFAGSIPLKSQPIGSITPWSGRPALEKHANMTRMLAIVFACFVVWAALFSVDKVTRGAGRLVPSTQNQLVQHLEGGIVKQILVQEGQTGIIDEQARGRVAEVSSLRARLDNLRREERLALDQLAKLERAYAEEAISEREVLDKRAALLSLRTRIADVENQIPQSSAGVSEAGARRGEIWTRDMEAAKGQAAALRLELAKADEQYTAVQDRVDREEIRAPIDGIINRLNVQTLGGVIRGGEPVAEIVPLAKEVTIEARIAPKDRGDIWPGLPAKVKISAYDSSVYGSLDAKVIDISPDAIQDPRGGMYYRVRLKATTTSFGPGKPVVPGMMGEVSIRSGNQTILNYILGPLIRIRDEAFRE